MSDGSSEIFKEIMVEEAARDKRMLGTQEWLITGETELVSESFLDGVDEAELSADVAEYYDLTPEEVARAMEISEDLIISKNLGPEE